MSTYNIYLALIAQLDKLARHNRQGSYQTKRRYYEAMQRFCRYLAEEYHLQKLTNISGKHFVAYVEHLQNSGKSASTINLGHTTASLTLDVYGHVTDQMNKESANRMERYLQTVQRAASE